MGGNKRKIKEKQVQKQAGREHGSRGDAEAFGVEVTSNGP